jgi:adenine-specific DNA-methyltransferase
MSKYHDLVKKLKEVFQIDKPQLDFGIYRILNSRVDEINDYLEKRLSAKVKESLSQANTQNLQHIEQALHEATKNAQSLGMNPDDAPKVVELRQQLVEQKGGASDHENAVYSHLLTFFSRYYEKGDFISQRRYKGDTYAVPYAGEEVVLHWANKDQYYTKSGENFSNYAFKIEKKINGQTTVRTVRCRLVSADTAKDNRKDNDKERRFVLIETHTRTQVDEEGDEFEENLIPIEEINGELVLRFEYRAMPKGSKQEDLVSKAVETVLGSSIVQTNWPELQTLEPTEKKPTRTLLEKALTNYTAKNTADYFIHKDLGSFLQRELDFYIKNEVMNLDDVQDAQSFKDIEKNLRLIQTLRAIAKDLITFLAQLEDFQKKLWLKKKFVVAANYCMTLDRVPESLYPKIVENSKQWQQWQSMGMLVKATSASVFNQIEDGTVDYLKANPFLMVDTALFDSAFKYELLASISDLDENLDGLLIHGDNFQALNLLQERYKHEINCVHIDPPYNTATSGFLYKNQYQHSSWLSMMWQTIYKTSDFLDTDGVFQCHIDENEYENLFLLFENIGLPNCGSIIWDKKNPMLGRKGVATQHEYILWRSENLNPIYLKNDNVVFIIQKAREFISNYGGVNDQSRQTFSKWINSQVNLTGGEKAYKFLEDDGTVYRGVAMGAPEPRSNTKFHIPLIHPVTGKSCPVPPNGWSRTPETLALLIQNNEILWGTDHTTQPQKKVYLGDDSKRQLSSVIQNASSGKKYMDLLGLVFPYCHPVSLYIDLFASKDGSNNLILDYFAGSGTTAHAIIDLNRQDNGNRKYILVELGDYFDTVLKPRVQKVVYSADWKDGKATAPQTGVSHAFKVLKMESYEDTLNNLELKRSPQQIDLLSNLPDSVREDYLLRYMLDIESRGSLLSVEDFKQPFDYKLKIAIDSAGAYEERNIDLIETFNYLIGLRVDSIVMQSNKGFATIEGVLPTGEKTLVLWRDVEKVDYEALNKICDKLKINPKDSEFEVIYINGDHNIPTTLTALEDEGGITKTLKLRQIEPEFLRLMFETI